MRNVDFTREPIIETIITPKDGCKLVVRSSKSTGQEEYFVDAVEVVAFGHAFFFRSLERPKSFLVPVSDYEVLEVREARMVLKNVAPDRSIKIGGGREGQVRASREAEKVELTTAQVEEEVIVTEGVEGAQPTEGASETRPDTRLDKKRDRRRHYRKRKGGREEGKEEAAPEAAPSIPPLEDDKIDLPPPENPEGGDLSAVSTPLLFSSLLQPPPTLISETIGRYRENALFKSAFFLTEEEEYKPHDKVQELLNEDEEGEYTPSLKEPTYETQQEQQTQEEGSAQQEEIEVQESQELLSQAIEEKKEVSHENGRRRKESASHPKEAETSLQEEPSQVDSENEEAALPLFAEEENSHNEEPPFIGTEGESSHNGKHHEENQ